MPIIIDLPEASGDTLADLVEELYARGFRYLADETGRAKRFINEAIDKTCEEERWPFLEVVAEDAGDGSELVNLLAVESVIHNGLTLAHEPRKTLVRGNVDRTLPGTPLVFWIEEGAMLRTYPVTADGLEVHYWLAPTWLDADADVCIVPKRFSGVVLDQACFLAEKDRRGWESASAFKAEWVDGIQRMRDSLLAQQHSDHDLTIVTQEWA